jgi:hypothetical protein
MAVFQTSAHEISWRPSLTKGRRTHIGVAAWHEAGHALAAMREGHWVVAVEVSAYLPGAGITRQRVKRRPNRFNPVAGPGNARAAWEDTLAGYLAELRVTLAGPLAEAKAFNRSLRGIGAEFDLEKCRQLAQRLQILRDYVEDQGVDCGAPVWERFNAECERVRRWVARPVNWRAIEKIAWQLMEKHRITAREVFACYLESRAGHQQSLPLSWDAVDSAQTAKIRRQAA